MRGHRRRRRHVLRSIGRRNIDLVSRYASGVALISLAIGWALVNTSDVISDMKDWHGVGQPSVIGPLMKQVGSTIVAAIGGSMFPARAPLKPHPHS